VDPDVNIYQRQIQMEVEEKYQLYERIKELTEEINTLKEKLKKIEKK